MELMEEYELTNQEVALIAVLTKFVSMTGEIVVDGSGGAGFQNVGNIIPLILKTGY